MQIFYSAVEVIEMAIKTEETGFAFYTDAAKTTRLKSLASLFTQLAQEEKKHKKFFNDLFSIVKRGPATIPFDWEEVGLYLKAITDSKFFLGKDKALSFLKRAKSPKALLDYALAFEKETLLFYHEIKNFVKPEEQDIVSKIIDQEKEHIRKLSQQKYALIKKI
ncbi:MAG: ferritin family protein [candidate division WOR-3 bacterium]|nr:ferritin family protein [candidate division WOR-3 bacterium]